MQRAAGNAATTALLSRRATPATAVGSVQREPPGSHAAPAGTGTDLLPFPSLGPPPDRLDFASRSFAKDALPTICPRCHQDKPTVPMFPRYVDREATEDRLVDWGQDAPKMLHNGWLVRRLQLDPAGLGPVVDDYGLGLVKRITSTHEFTGSAAARERGVEIVRRRWPDIRPAVHDAAAGFYREELTTAVAFTPPAASPVLNPDVLRAVLALPPTPGVQLGRHGATAKPGQEVGPFVIVNGTSTDVYLTRVGKPLWIYQIGAGDYIKKHDPFLAAVAGEVYDSTKWILHATPLILKVAAFGLGFSGSIVLVLAGIALDELATEMEADVEGRPGRTPLEILGSAGTQLLIDRFFHGLFGGAKGAGSVAGAGKLAPKIERIADRAVPVVKKELAAAERPLVKEALDRGAARHVTDPALKAQGYTMEVAVDSAGHAHVFRLKGDGTWCRFSDRICGLDLGTEVVAAAKNPTSFTQGKLDETRGLLTEIGKEADVLARTYERMRAAGKMDVALLSAEERTLLDQLAPSGNAADLSLKELRDLPTELGLKKDIAAALRREEELVKQLYREGRPLYEIMRAASPSYASRARVLTDAAGRDAATVLRPRSGALHVDHVVPLNEIVRMPGFDKLRPERQLEIVNDVRNLRAVDALANTSRGDRSWHDWANALLHYDAAALGRMRVLEDEMRTYLAGRILTLGRP
ncbi:hypothetical protein SAMN05216184_101279 [Georgenia satyanarayanai]|uniref:Uncharacterized protein n=2 Tax=Georgenia satyanarayanai TaxID=860221 RepID=A0A2Y8ZXB7_9MICO|nr:hypothetical protein A8987_101279 [Georgenia satyanarayanai]SSA36615.1 hypothetical protein SAMN05216184_101279 [Georgenia satyanarayanai]